MSWRQASVLQAQQFAGILEDQKFIEEDFHFSYVEHHRLSSTTSQKMHRGVFCASRIMSKIKLPPEQCFGGPFLNPYFWLCNVIVNQNPQASVTRVRAILEGYVSELILANGEAGQMNFT
jgi:hypothetical protein